jgi:hypothetical protein
VIRNIRAVAIDNEKDDLEAIHQAAIQADINCRPIHYPNGLTEEVRSELANHQIRLVICDLHLQADGAMGGGANVYGVIGSLLEGLGIQPWSPYIMLLWSIDAGNKQTVDELRKFLEERVQPQYLPSAIIPLEKSKYGIPGKPTSEQAKSLWMDLREKLTESRGTRLLLQWEAELIRAAGQVTCNLMATIRRNGAASKKIVIDDEIDTLLSRIANAATSKDFAQEHTRLAVVEGLLPLVSDQYQHQQLSAAEQNIWDDGLREAKTKRKQKPLSITQAAVLNSALHIACDDSIKSPERGTVFEAVEDEVATQFSITDFAVVFGIDGKWAPDKACLRFIQIEGACDAIQRKKGVVPLVLAAEVDAGVNLKPKGKGLPESVEDTPIFLDVIAETPKKLLVNVRYYFTLERSKLRELKPVYRLRGSLMAKLAFAWANHSVRPGIVFFGYDDTSAAEAADPDTDATSEPRTGPSGLKKIGAAILGIFKEKNK